MPRLFTLPHVWSGGHFELEIDYRGASVGLLRAALGALFLRPELRGLYESRDIEPRHQRPVESPSLGSPRYGVFAFPAGDVPCLLHDVCDELILGVPMGGLELHYPVGAYPFEDGTTLEWRDEVTEFLFGIAKAVYPVAPFVAGAIGHELDDDFLPKPGAPIPEERWDGLIVVEDGTPVLYPPTKGAPHTIP